MSFCVIFLRFILRLLRHRAFVWLHNHVVVLILCSVSIIVVRTQKRNIAIVILVFRRWIEQSIQIRRNWTCRSGGCWGRSSRSGICWDDDNVSSSHRRKERKGRSNNRSKSRKRGGEEAKMDILSAGTVGGNDDSD